MKKFFGEFKAFIMRGNVLDMAVGVIIATAFGKITTSLVNDVLMPVIGYIFGGSDAADALNVTLRAAVLDAEGNVVTPASVLGFGTFLIFCCWFVFPPVLLGTAVSILLFQRDRAAEPEAEPEPEWKKYVNRR